MIGSNTSLDKIFHRAVIFDPQLRQARSQERQLHISRQLRRMLDSALPGGSCSEHRRPLLPSFPCSLPDPHVRRHFPRSTHGGRRLAHDAPFRRPSTSRAWTVWHLSCDPGRCTTLSMASVLSFFLSYHGWIERGWGGIPRSTRGSVPKSPPRIRWKGETEHRRVSATRLSGGPHVDDASRPRVLGVDLCQGGTSIGSRATHLPGATVRYDLGIRSTNG